MDREGEDREVCRLPDVPLHFFSEGCQSLPVCVTGRDDTRHLAERTFREVEKERFVVGM